jgi:mRNA interferase YafQ
MLDYTFPRQFKKDMELMEKRHKDIDKIENVMSLIINEIALPPSCHNHLLHGAYEGKFECHVQPDWLLIYEPDPVRKKVMFYRTGTHSDLF